MRIIMMLMLMLAWTSLLTSCNTNAIPQTGPTMEQAYNSMGDRTKYDSEGDQKMISRQKKHHALDVSSNKPKQELAREFHKLPNPEIKMYVYPHLASCDASVGQKL